MLNVKAIAFFIPSNASCTLSNFEYFNCVLDNFIWSARSIIVDGVQSRLWWRWQQ